MLGSIMQIAGGAGVSRRKKVRPVMGVPKSPTPGTCLLMVLAIVAKAHAFRVELSLVAMSAISLLAQLYLSVAILPTENLVDS
jgi:hypothetical protein